MPIYKEGENNKLVEDVRRQREEHDQAIQEATKILKQDIPPFLAIAMASRVIGRKEAEELYAIISKNKLQKT